MAEIKTPVEQLEEGKTYTAGEREFLIRNEHTFADIIRFLISEGCDKEEAMILYDMEATDQDSSSPAQT